MSEDNKQVHQKGLVVTLNVTFSLNDIKKAYKVHLDKVTSEVDMKGFRKGNNDLKRKALEKRRGALIRAEAIDHMLQEAISKTVNTHGHKIASRPRVVNQNGDGVSKDVNIEVAYDVFSDIPEAAVEKLSVEVVKPKITKENIEEEIKKLQEHHGQWATVSRAAKDADKLKIDFVGRMDKELFEGGSATDQEIVLGEGKFIPGFEENLVGKKAEETVVFPVTFPKDYHAEALAGKKAEFEVKIQSVSALELHAVNEELYTLAGTKAKDQESFETALKERLELDAARLAQAINRRRMMASLKDKISFPLPDSVLKEEIDSIQKEDKDVDDKTAKKTAEASLSLGLLLRHYVEKWSIKATDEEVRDYIMMVAPNDVPPAFFLEWYMKDQDRLEQIRGLVLEQNVLNKILTVVQAKEVLRSLKDIEAELKED